MEETNKMLQQEKNQQSYLRKNNNLGKPLTSKTDDSFFKVIELEKKLKTVQEEADRLRREKEEKKKEETPLLKQIKLLEMQIKEKETSLSELKK